MNRRMAAFAAIALILSLTLTSCKLFSLFKEGETTPEISFDVTAPNHEEETTPAQTTPAATDPDFPNEPDPDGTKRY